MCTYERTATIRHPESMYERAHGKPERYQSAALDLAAGIASPSLQHYERDDAGQIVLLILAYPWSNDHTQTETVTYRRIDPPAPELPRKQPAIAAAVVGDTNRSTAPASPRRLIDGRPSQIEEAPEPRYTPNSYTAGGWPTDEEGYTR